MKKKLLALACAIIPLFVFSQHRSESEAISVAQEFWGDKVHHANLRAVSQKSLAQAKARVAKSDAEPESGCQSFYVINDEEHNRFVIVSSDDRLYKILGYSNNGCFDADNIPEALLEIMEGYNSTYNYLTASDTPPKTVAKAGRNVVSPMIKTQWNQANPYNAECPIDPRFEQYADNEDLWLKLGISIRCATGCVATAMAQVMNYYQYPAKGTGFISYNTRTLNIAQSMDFSKMPFDWANMATTYADANYTEAQKNAVARLMHVCGNSVIMDYAQDGSGAMNPDLAYALIHYFKYNSNIRHYEKNYFSPTEWKNIIQTDLEEGRPIIYTGQGIQTNEDGTTSSYGHAFILDGCDSEGKYHINWGYEGRYDGYFELTALDIADSNYNLAQAMICNITPQTIGESEDVFCADKFIHSDWLQDKKKVGDYASAVLYEVYCYSVDANTYNTKFNGEIGIGLFDANRNFIKSLDSYTANVNAFTGWKSKSFMFKYDGALFTEGSKYNIAPYAKAKSSSKPTLLRTTMGVSDAYNVKVSDGKITVNLGWLDIPSIQNEIVPGNYAVSAFNFSNTRVDWNIQISKDEASDKVWFTNIDPVAAKDAAVYGEIIGNGTQIRIPVNQKLGENKFLYNYSSNDDIIVYVSDAEPTMTIQDTWGTVERRTSGENASQKELTQYSSSTLKYIEPGSDIVETPVIIVNNKRMTITCPTEGVSIYYTIGGAKPDKSSLEYKGSVVLTDNRVIKAIAYKGSKSSTIAEKNDIAEFKISKPEFAVSENKVRIFVQDPDDAEIYYTDNGSDPKTNGKRYNKEIVCDGSTTIIAYAVKKYWLDSDISEYVYTQIPTPTPDPNPDPNPVYEMAIKDLTAGTLAASIPSSSKATIKSLWISGELNGSDIKLIKEMASSGSLTDLDIQNTRIVSGGEAYYSSFLDDYTTETDIVSEYMFYGCKKLITLILPASTKKIKSFAIDECDNLKSISIPSKCEELEMMAIYGCKNLESVNILASLKKLDDTNFSRCPKLNEINVSNDNAYFKSTDGNLYTKNGQSLLRYPIGKDGISFAIPNGVTKIGSYAFYQSNLQEVDIPSSVTFIGDNAFGYCNKLVSINIPNSVTTIELGAFMDCASLANVSLSDNVTDIEMLTFAYCPSLQSFTIGKNVVSIDGTAFTGCASLKSFSVDEGNRVFSSTDGVIYTKNGKTLVKCPIAYYATSYTIPAGVEVIAENAFQKCQKIENFTFPESLKVIETNAFSSCSMTSISLPIGLRSIGWMAFEGCDKLETFVIPENIADIPMMMLYGCDNLSYLYLPSNIKTVDLSAFSRCKKLATINSDIVDIASVEFATSYDGKVDAFDGIDKNCVWNVPDNCAAAYKAQSWWINTWSIVEKTVSVAEVSNDSDVILMPGARSVEIVSSTDKIINIYNINGHLVDSVAVKAGQQTTIPLQHGVYIINKSKIYIN